LLNSRNSAKPLLFLLLATAACGGTDTAGPNQPPDQLVLSAGQVRSLDSTGTVIEQANPNDGTLKSLVDSTLLVLTSGVVAKRIDVSTDLTADPLYFVVVHRVYVHAAGGSFSTWNVIGMNDPSHLTSLVEASGFAQSGGATAPDSVSGAIGDGTGIVNGLLLSVGSGGAVIEWFGSSGTASFVSGAGSAPCANFPAVPNVTCTLETVRLHFSTNASGGSGGTAAKHASVASDVEVPGLRLTYQF
jgi:hypothetical protein